jgi:hypothetical protein
MPDPIKKSTSYDSSTGETTFKASWSGNRSSISRGPITPKTTQRTVAARQANKPLVSRTPTAGERVAVAIKSPTAAGVVRDKPEEKSSAKVEVAKKPLSRKEIFEIKDSAEKERLAKKYPGMSQADARIKQQKEAEKYTKEQAKKSGYQKNTGGGNSEKQKSTSCRTC